MVQTCPVCSTPGEAREWGPLVRIDCGRCGKFALTRSLADDLPQYFERERVRAALMSNTIRRMQRSGGQVITIFPDSLETYWSRGHLPTPKEQADEFVLWIGDNQPNNMTYAHTTELQLDAWIGTALPTTPGAPEGLRWLMEQMGSPDPQKMMFSWHRGNGNVQLQLTFAGWERYAALKQTRIESRTAFMAMKFGDAELDSIVDKCFRPAVARTGFELRVLTDQQRAGLIDDQIRAALIAARFVIADLTHGSFGAYWEAGFADGRGLPVIYACRRAEWQKAKTHFDTNHMTTVLWDVGDLKTSEDEMTAIIRATLRGESKQSDD